MHVNWCTILPIFFATLSSSKLNVPSVLLPYNHDSPSNFTLKIQDGGCYKWSTSRQEVLLEEILKGDCSNEAVVTAITRISARINAVIIAKEITTGLTLRCDVIVDSIHRLEIVTTTRELYAEEAPEEFEVRGYDKYGNEFSSLVGQVLVWQLKTITDQSTVIPAEMVLRFITFEASPYETPHAIAPLENEGKQSYMVLIEGIRTGLARLSVKMAHTAYKDLPPAEVDLMVVANLILEPQDAYILPRTAIKYSVAQLKHGHVYYIDLGDSQYYLQVADKSIGFLEDDGISVSGMMLGVTSVILQDVNMNSFETLKKPSAMLHVVDPSYLSIVIDPHNNPALISGRKYAFLVHIYDKNNNKIFPSDNLVVETVVDSEYITTEFVSKNGTYIMGVPVQRGSTKIHAKLTAIDLEDELVAISPPLRASIDLEIFDQIRVTPPVTLLPWNPVTKPSYKVALTAQRSSGSVIWQTDNSVLIDVTTGGVCVTKGRGVASVTASLSVNPHNKGEANIIIEEVSHLKFVPGFLEVEIASPLSLSISMTAISTNLLSTGVVFSQCHQLPLSLKLQDSSYSASQFEPGTVSDSCVSFNVTSDAPGFSEISVSYDASSGVLSDSTLVGAFKPLRPVFPSDRSYIVLALGTSTTILFEGGPLPWPKKPSSHFVKVELLASPDDELEAHLVSKKSGSEKSFGGEDVHAVFVECKSSSGEFDITLVVGNEASASLPRPVHKSSRFTVVCDVPDSLRIQSALPVLPGCPFADKSTMVSLPGLPVPLEVILEDSEGRRFDNVSSLAIRVATSDESFGHVSLKPRSSEFSSAIRGFHVIDAVQHFLMPRETIGTFEVTASVNGFLDSSISGPLQTVLSDSLRVTLINSVAVEPPALVLYNREGNKGDINVVGGSGHFEITNNGSIAASVRFLMEQNKIIVTPLNDGNATVVVRDLCLSASFASCDVRISSLGSLEARVADRVELDDSVLAEVIARDVTGNHVPIHPSMKVTPHPKTDVIAVTFVEINEFGNAIFRVRGNAVGETSLRFSCERTPLSSSSQTFSRVKSIQVFPPLTISPEQLSLVVGSTFQVETRGGPYPDVSVSYTVHNETICSVSHSGIMNSISVGSTVLTAKATIVYKDGSELVVLSKNSMAINVVMLKAIHISVPLRFIEAGQTMPMYASGMDSVQETPFTYGSADPSLQFEWTLSSKYIGSFSSFYSDNDVLESKENNGRVTFRALKAGRVSVSLKVSPVVDLEPPNEQITNNGELVDKIEIRVFEPLKLVQPHTDDARILLAPNSKTKIVTNRDVNGEISYLVVDCVTTSESSSPIVEVSSDGIVSAGLALGDASIRVFVREKFGVTQTLSLLVEVRALAYIEAKTTRFMSASSGSPLAFLPVGLSHELLVTYHDSRGRVFTQAGSVVEFRPSRFDLINVQRGSKNHSLSISVRGSGSTVLRVWDRYHPEISDYVVIKSGPVIVPNKISVPVGSLVCFSSDLRGPSGEVGLWSSSLPSSLHLDASSGVGAVQKVSKVTVTYEVSSSISTVTEVIITSITEISLVAPNTFISNYVRDEGFFISVKIEGEEGVEVPSCGSSSHNVTTSITVTPEVPFVCEIKFDKISPGGFNAHDIFNLTPLFVPDKGLGCLLRAVESSDPIFASSRIQLSLSVSALTSSSPFSLEGAAVSSNETSIPFLPAAVLDLSNVIVSPSVPGSVILHGLPEVTSSFAVVQEISMLSVEIESVEETKAVLVISSTGDDWTVTSPEEPPAVVSLISSLTKQVLKIEVSLEDDCDDAACIDKLPSKRQYRFITSAIWAFLTRYHKHLLSLACLSVTIICVIYGYFALSASGYKQTQDSSVFAKSPDGHRHFARPLGAPMKQFASPFSSSASDRKKGNEGRRQSPDGGISLWSVDQEPIYGDPMFRSSPRAAYDGSPTYCPRDNGSL